MAGASVAAHNHEFDKKLGEARKVAMTLGKRACLIDATNENSDFWVNACLIFTMATDGIGKIADTPQFNQFTNFVREAGFVYSIVEDAITLLGAKDFGGQFDQGYQSAGKKNTTRHGR